MNALLNDILKDCAHYTKEGAVANYIPELAKADADKFGIYIITHFGQQFSAVFTELLFMVFPDAVVQLPGCFQHGLVVQVQIADGVQAHPAVSLIRRTVTR